MNKISKTTRTSGTKPQVVFFGSGPVAARSLELLLAWCEVEAVITKPRPPHHRGTTPVIDLCEQEKLPYHTAKNKQELSDLFTTESFNSRLGILIDFGIIVNKDVIDYFPLGILNSHFSLLPEWRGADPITFAILSGQKMTGVSLMLLVEAMDEGPLISYGEQPLDGSETTPELTERLILLSDALLRHYVPLYQEHLKSAAQDITGRKESYSRKLTKEDGVIDWQKPAGQLEREVRAFLEWPKSRTALAGKDIVITKAHVIDESGTPGQAAVKDKQLFVYCGTKALGIDELIPAGKKQMTGEAFLAGHRHLL